MSRFSFNRLKGLGFTLIELLVVIAIISILAALIFPVFARAKFAARKTANISNLKQITIGLLSYSTDSDEYLPTWCEVVYNQSNGIADTRSQTPDTIWDSKVVPYIKQGNSVADESKLDRSGVFHSPLAEQNDSKRSYGLSQMVVFEFVPDADGSWNRSQYRWRNFSLTSSSTPAATVLIGDSGKEGRVGPSVYWDGWQDKYSTKLGYYRREAPWRYDDRAGYAYIDGHVGYVHGDTIYPSPKLSSDLNTVFGMGFCAMAKWLVPTDAEANWNVQNALSRGVTCSK